MITKIVNEMDNQQGTKKYLLYNNIIEISGSSETTREEYINHHSTTVLAT